ncbi:hypothetical protein [Cognatiluteimonas telluris]|jgi:hypothetical protein|uniref:hypothetical protein n=1 Tax=Cognatiluteimonas telluris TaxID=1104775 RepID=UPI00140BD8CA|nr:hypothetical protein [Lysobacter telluris]
MLDKPVIYIQVHAGYLAARRMGGPTIRRECEALSRPRTLMGNFTGIEACFVTALEGLRIGGVFTLSPVVLVHLVPEAAGGDTDVEERAFQEAAATAGARRCKVVTGGQPLTEYQVAEACR